MPQDRRDLGEDTEVPAQAEAVACLVWPGSRNQDPTDWQPAR